MKDIFFYLIASTIIAGIAQLLGANLAVTILAALLIPPLILIIIRIVR